MAIKRRLKKITRKYTIVFRRVKDNSNKVERHIDVLASSREQLLTKIVLAGKDLDESFVFTKAIETSTGNEVCVTGNGNRILLWNHGLIRDQLEWK